MYWAEAQEVEDSLSKAVWTEAAFLDAFASSRIDAPATVPGQTTHIAIFYYSIQSMLQVWCPGPKLITPHKFF